MKDFSAARGSRTGYEGDYVLKEGVRHMKYNMNARGLSEIRAVPVIENGVPQPLFTSIEQSLDSLSDAFVKVDTVSFFGPAGSNMICPPAAPGEDKGPIHHFVDFIQKYVDDNPRSCPPDWRRWQGKKEDGDTVKPKEVLSRPSVTLMIQGYLIRHKGEEIMSREGKPTMRYPVVLCVRASGYNDFRDKLLTPKDINAPWGVWNNALGGDILDLAKGLTLIVEPYDMVYNNRPQTWYRCATGEPLPLTLEDATEVWAPWESILDLNPDYPTLGIRLAKAFNASTVIKVYEKCPIYRQIISDVLRDMARDEAGASYAAGVPPLPHAHIPGARTSPPPAAPSERAGTWTPSEPPIEHMPTGPDDSNEEGHTPPPASPATAIMDRVSSLRNRLQNGQQ